MGKTTCIRNGDWVIAWDDTNQRHTYLRHADVAFEGDRITFVGKGFHGPADVEVDGSRLCVMPGLVDIHCHPSTESFYRGIREEHGVPEMYMAGIYERMQALWPADREKPSSAEVAYCELLRSGVTTICDLSVPYPGWVDLIARSGLRGFVAPGYSSSRWSLSNRHQLRYQWDEAKGRRDFETSLKMIEEAEGHECGRLSGVLYPMQIDTCSEELLRDSVAVAKQRNLPLVTHVSQSVNEFLVMVDRHGKTPVQWAHEIGLLGPHTTLGHVVFIDEHSWLHWATRKDLHLLAETGITVAHCPTPFARYGQLLEDFGKYLRAGIHLGMGTDVAPHNLLEEIRMATVLARVAAEDITSVQMADCFHAATVGGARALLRSDLGRLMPGCRADIVLVDLDHPLMQPARDPLRNLVFHAADRAVRDVYIDGTLVVKDFKVMTLNHTDALGRLSEAQRRMEAAAPEKDYAGRSSLEISPLSLPVA